MHIVLAVEELNGIHGGVERTIINLANGLIDRCHSVTILTYEPADSGKTVYSLNEKVGRIYLELRSAATHMRSERETRTKLKDRLPSAIISSLRNIFALCRIWKARRFEIPTTVSALKKLQPDVVISFKTHFHRYILPAAHQAGIPAIASDHNPPDILYYEYICSVDRYVIRRNLFKAARIRVLLKEFIGGYPKKIRDRCVAIANGVDLPAQPETTERPLERLSVILNVGRLYFQKDQATLIHAFALLADLYPDWQVHIYGDGELEFSLKKIIEQYGLENRVLMKGPTDNVMDVYKSANIFALPSLFEGFGNVTLEAMANSLPVVAFDNIAANRQLIQTNETGILVSSEDRIKSFADGLDKLMKDPISRKKMGCAARQAASGYDRNTMLDLWESLIQEASHFEVIP